MNVKAEKYMHIVTNQLRPVVEHTMGSWGWDKIGTTSSAINLDAIDGANMIEVDEDGDKINETHYLLPIVDETQANKFKTACGVIGLEVVYLSYDDAIAEWKRLKALKPVKEEV